MGIKLMDKKLSDKKMELLNNIVQVEMAVNELLDLLAMEDIDQNWVKEGKMNIYTGFMCLEKAVER